MDDPCDHVSVAADLYEQGRFSDAIAFIQRARLAGTEKARGLVISGRCYASLGLAQDALRCYREAAALSDLPDLRLLLAAERDDSLSDADQEKLLPGFSLPRTENIQARRFLDKAAAHLSTIYTNDNLITFQRALTFLNDPQFMRSVYLASESQPSFDDRTWRAHILVWAARNALKLEGDFVELGTYRAYFAKCVTRCLNFGEIDRRLFLFDTFAGLADDAVPEPELPEFFYVGLKEHYGQPDIYASVVEHFRAMPNVRVVKGKVPDSLRESAPVLISWLHIDLNSAAHEIAALDFLWDRIATGAFIILDDFGACVFKSQTKAHLEFFGAKGLPVAELPTGQGLVIKR